MFLIYPFHSSRPQSSPTATSAFHHTPLGTPIAIKCAFVVITPTLAYINQSRIDQDWRRIGLVLGDC